MEKLKKELEQKGFLIKIRSAFFNEQTWEWETKENYYLKVEWKIYLAKQDIRLIDFEILKNDEESVIVKAILKVERDWRDIQSIGIAEVKKKLKNKKGEIVDNIKALEKCQSIALGKALSYLWYGIEFWGAVTADEIIDATQEAETSKVNLKEKQSLDNAVNEEYKSDISWEGISKKVYDYSKKKYWVALSYEEQKRINELLKEWFTQDKAIEKLKEDFNKPVNNSLKGLDKPVEEEEIPF